MNDGIVLVDKPVGVTSHDVVNFLRRKLNTKKIGHAGTLDPFASGLLIAGVKKGTRVLEYFLDMDKTYRAELELGRITDTFDNTGKTVEEREVPALSEDEIVSVLKSFEGEYLQVPPAYSAKKYNGERLYKLAREGKIINLPPRAVRVYSMTNISYSRERITFTARVSKGTYIRSLAMDIGYKLGCGATTTNLRRTSQGRFSVDSAFQIDDVSQISIIPLEEAVDFLPGLLLSDSETMNVLLGRQIYASGVAGILGKFAKDEIIRIVGSDEHLVAIARSERTSSFVKTLLRRGSVERVAKLVKVLGA
ncbi:MULTISPECIES: tRNA pseudouridine(55) synthase TruB [unclassified Mesotoga]|uniref:tRNA pseudouridine(55) synthase TruB n=1 Tax=unclassified Mesotoga TaxID=1184398 RepID=UPI000DA67359|nr:MULTISPECIES: tRNA pseudouridine(55) synthase TruB [unclassified Mesotoga]PZC52555.1 tRNA pseudouridine synthase B [Mesotoga sp. TolDC]